MTPAVIAIDGAAGSGKSTLARGLAVRLGLPYINTGLMYRALAAEAIHRGVSPHDGASLAAASEDLRFVVAGDPPELEVEGHPLNALSSPEVEGCVSAVSRHPEVRERMRARQRALGERTGAVMEGRDIGSVVFPDAPVKLYLTAETSVRERRRAADRPSQDQARVGDALRTRDDEDAVTNPFVPPEEAVVIDTADRNIEETLAAALDVVAREAPELLERR